MSSIRHKPSPNTLKKLNSLYGLASCTELLKYEPLCSLYRQLLTVADNTRFALFGYGSLMWKPNFHPAFTKRARIYGLSRQPCIKSNTYRGTLHKPGLVLGLDAGGSCVGMALGLPQTNRNKILATVLLRECFQGVYWPRVLQAHVAGGTIPCLAFIANRSSPGYAPPQSVARVREIIMTASGQNGRCIDYWLETRRYMKEVGIKWDDGLGLESAT